MDYFVGTDELLKYPKPLTFLDDWVSGTLIPQMIAQTWTVTEVNYPNDGMIVGIYRVIPQGYNQASLPTLPQALTSMLADIFNRGYSNQRVVVTQGGWVREPWISGIDCYCLQVFF